MPTALVIISTILAGCSPDDMEGATGPLTVADACIEVDPGHADPSSDAAEGIHRTNCYRNLMALEPGILNPQLDDAAQGHADYMAQNSHLTHQQDSSRPGFTGEWMTDRAAAAGYNWSGGIMETVSKGAEPAGAVDLWMDSVYHRVPFTVPTWSAAGFGQNGVYSAMTQVHPFPEGEEVLVVYPVDGQRDVPTSFDSDTEYPDPAPDHGVVGYPVTLTVGSASHQGGSNPYGLVLEEAWIQGPDGDLEILTGDPEEDQYLGYMAFLLPTSPLDPGQEYEAGFHVRWKGGEETVITTFTTKEAR